MGRQIAGNRDEDVPALVRVAPRAELTDSRLQHLIRMEACIFAQHRMRERGDQRLRRMAKREMPCHQACGEIDLSLPVEGVEQAAPILSGSTGRSSSRSPPSPGMRPGGTFK